MDIEEFQSFIKRMMNSELSEEQLLLSYTLGLCGEAAEVFSHIEMVSYDHEKFIEQICKPIDARGLPEQIAQELSDLLHYAIGLSTFFPESYITTYDSDDNCSVASYRLQLALMQYVVVYSGNFADMVKKTLFHGKPRDEYAITSVLSDVIGSVYDLITSMNLTPEEVAKINYDKLIARHGGEKFKTEVYSHVAN